jgi:hypothetical protein
MGSKERTTSFDLIAFKINQDWDNGCGYDYECPVLTNGDSAFVMKPANWAEARTGIPWANGTGVYSGSPSGITIATQHFDLGNENIEIDITSYVNGLLTGDTNYGLGLAYARAFELISTSALQYVGFFTKDTQTFYEPYIETIYNNHILDARNNFYLDVANKLYLYVNLAGNPTNLDSLPSVNVYDADDALVSAYTSTAVTHVTKGVYSIDLLVPTTSNNKCTLYTDVWTGLTINNINRPNITLDFEVKDSLDYYQIGSSDMLPKKVALNISGIQNDEKIKRGDIRKVLVSARIPYTVEQTQNISDLQYRIYVKEGANQLTVIDYQPLERTANNYYFLLDTASLIPNEYYMDVLVTSNLEATTLKETLGFEVVSLVDFRKSQ